MRSPVDSTSFVRRTAVQTAVHAITTGVLIALLTAVETPPTRERLVESARQAILS
jgi:hypothetical protein